MPTIEVFLMFPPSDRNRHTLRNGSSTLETGPNWTAISSQVARDGYALTLHGPSIHPSVAEVNDSMKNAEVTLFIGHGGGGTDTSGTVPKWISSRITLVDGSIISPDGLFEGRWSGSTFTKATNGGAKVGVKNVTGIFTCNSFSKLPEAFAQEPGSHLITNDGGPNGLTRVGTLELGAAEFVVEYARTKGNVSSAMAKAQRLFSVKGWNNLDDRGDKLHDTIGAAAPKPATPAGPVAPRRVPYGPID